MGSSAVPVYTGPFGPAQAERLLWRAGFGPRPAEREALALRGLESAVLSLTRPAAEILTGPEPMDESGTPLDPEGTSGHDHLWWLDRMVRTSRPLVERMALVWHDWFATSNAGVSSRHLMLRQNELFRRRGLGSFEKLLYGVTRDPAMLVWLSGAQSNRWAPNEDFARELMELFTLGPNRGYTERDVREQARALTGWHASWKPVVGPFDFRYVRRYHDPGVKRIFGRRGRFDWKDAVRLTVRHRKHPSFFVRKLWGCFIPTPIDRRTQRALERLYVSRRYRIRPVVEAVLKHPELYEGPRMVKPPVVFTAGLLRALGRGVDTVDWVTIAGTSGQRLFYPPSAAGWDDSRWLGTGEFRGRWQAIALALKPLALQPLAAAGTLPMSSTELVDRAIAFWGAPPVSAETRAALLAFADRALADANRVWKQQQYPVLVQNALRQLLAVSPDFQTS